MSRGIPRFKATQQITPAPTSEVAGGAQSLTQLGQRIQTLGSQQLVKTAVTKATAAGELAGINPDFKLERFGGLAGDAFNKAALQANRTMLGTDVILNTERLKIEATDSSPDAAVALNNFNQSAQQYGEKLINQTPSANKGYIQNMLNFHVGSAQNVMLQNIHKQQVIKGAAQWLQSDNAYKASTIQALNNINFNQPKEEVQKGIAAAGAMLVERNKATELAAEGGFIKEKTARLQKLDNQQQFNIEAITAQFRSKLQEGGEAPQKFIQSVEDASLKGPTAGPLKGMDITQRNKLANLLLSEQKKFKNAKLQSNFMVNQAFKDEQERVLNGATPNKVVRDAYLTAFPDRGPFYDTQIQVNQEISQNVPVLNESSFIEQDKLINSLKPRDPNAKNFVPLEHIWKGTRIKMDQENHDYKADKVKWAASNPSVVAALNHKAQQLKSGVNFDLMQSNGIKPMSVNPIDQIEVTQIMKGTPVSEISVMTDASANNVANMIHSTSIGTGIKIQKLDDLRDTYGDHYTQLMQQLVRDDKVSSMETFLTAVSPNDPDASVIDQAINVSPKILKDQIDKARLKDYETLTTAPLVTGQPGFFARHIFRRTVENNPEMDNFIQSHLEFNANGTDTFLGNVKTFTDHVALSMMVKNHSLSAADALKNAKKLIAGKFNYTLMGGKTQRIPKQFAPDAVTTYAKDYEKRLKDFPFPPGKFQNGDPMSRTENLKGSILPGGYVANGGNDGWQWVREDGTLLRDGNGQPFGFKFKDAIHNAPISIADLHKETNQLQAPSAAEAKVQKMLANVGRGLTGAFERAKK